MQNLNRTDVLYQAVFLNNGNVKWRDGTALWLLPLAAHNRFLGNGLGTGKDLPPEGAKGGEWEGVGRALLREESV